MADKITLAWTDRSDNEDSFKIYRSTTKSHLDAAALLASGSTYLITTTAAGATSYEDTDVAAGTTYYYRVAAVKSGVQRFNIEHTSNNDPVATVEAVAPVTQEASLINWWKLEDETDSKGTADLSWVNDAGVGSGGKNGNCYIDDGTIDYGQTSANINLSGDAFSLTFWVKNTSDGTYPVTHYKNGYSQMIGIGAGSLPSSASVMFEMGPYPAPASGTAAKAMEFAIRTGGSTASLSIAGYNTDWTDTDTGGLFPAGHDLQVWHHYAIVYNDGANLKFYTNGILRHTKTVSGALNNSTSAFLVLGRRIWVNDYDFMGNIDDVRLYDMELDADDVADIWNSGNGDWP